MENLPNILFGFPQYKGWIPLLKKNANSYIANFKTERELKELISKNNIKIVVPCSFTQMKLLANVSRNKSYDIISCEDYSSVEICNDKTKFSNFMTSNGFDDYIPKKYYKTSFKIKFPVIFKHSVTSSGIGSEICYNMDDLNRKIKEAKKKYIIQEYIVSKSEYAGNMYVKNGVIIHSIYYRKDYDQKYYIQRGSMFNQKGTYKRIDPEPMRKHENNVFSKILRKLNFTGFLCFDFKIVDDTVKIFEINPRLGGTLLRIPEHFEEMLNKVRKIEPKHKPRIESDRTERTEIRSVQNENTIDNNNNEQTKPTLEQRLELLEKEILVLKEHLKKQNSN